MSGQAAVPLLVDSLGPTRSGSGAEVLRSFAVVDRADRAHRRLDQLQSDRSPGPARYGAAIGAALDRLDPEGRLAAFDTPQAGWDLDTGDWPLETVTDRRSRADVDLTLWRHLAGLPLGLDLHVIVPPSEQPFTLPHLGLAVHPAGPLAASIQPDGGLGVGWDDGFAVTLPGRPTALSLEPPPDTVTAGRLRRLPTWEARAVEPATPDVRDAFRLFEPTMNPRDITTVLHAQSTAQQVLRLLWPEAADSVDNWLRGWMPLTSRNGTRSHSSPRLPGVVLTSATDPYQAADLLCHEVAHMRLSAVLAHDPLLDNGLATGYPSPWRSDSRPLLGLLLGVHAFLDVCGFHRRVIDSNAEPTQTSISSSIFERQAARVQSAWATLTTVAEPTPVGQILLSNLEREVARL